ncbi:MAG: hypothetical protein ACE5OS_10010 [Anaerolineae bacterium]
MRGLDVHPQKAYRVIYCNRPVGEIKFGHQLIGGSVFVFPVAIRDINDIRINNLKNWMRV